MLSQDFLQKMAAAKIASGPGANQNRAYADAPIQDLLNAFQNRSGVRMSAGGEGEFEERLQPNARLGGFDIVPLPNGQFAVNRAGVPGMGASQHNDSPYDIYDAQGNYLGSNTWKDIGTDGTDKIVDGATKALTAAFIGGGMLGGFGMGPMAQPGGFFNPGTAASSGGGLTGGASTFGSGIGNSGSVSLTGNVFDPLVPAGSGFNAAGVPSLTTMAPNAQLGFGGTSFGGLGAMGGAFGPGGATGAGGGVGGGGGSAGGAGGGSGAGESLIPGMSNSSLLGMGATALGALGGAQGQNAETSSTRQLPSYLQGPVANDLIPRTQGLLASQMPAAQAAGDQLLAKGQGLLGRTAPETAQNPYLKSIADDMQRRTMDLLTQNNLAIQGNAVGVGGLGGSRQGVAQGVGASRAADSLQGQVAGLYGNAYETDQNRLRQDWTLGSGMVNQGLNAPFQPLQNTADIFAPFSGFGTTTNNQSSGGGWQGGVGGALAGASMGRQMGWW